MDKKKIIILIILLIFLIFSGVVYFNSHKTQTEPVNIYVFRGEGCPHCAAELKFLKSLAKDEYKNKINIVDYEVWYNETNQKKLTKVSEKLGTEITGVPFTIIGNKYFSGYGEAMDDNIIKMINAELTNTDRQSVMDSIN